MQFSHELKQGSFLATGELINLDLVPEIINNFYRYDILLHLYTIVGFPTETEKEAFQTYRFLKRFNKKLTLDWQIYPLRVLENAPLAENAAKYGLEIYINHLIFY